MQSILENKNSDRDCFVTVKRWLENRNKGKTFVDYFVECGYNTIGIYGAGDLGRLLYDEIRNSNIKVQYFVDRNAEGIKAIDGIPVVMIDEIEKMNEVDILIITPIGNYNLISKLLVMKAPILRTLSLKDAVYEF